MNKLDDVALIQKFVEGELSFLANQNLRIEPAFNTAQLLAKKGELVATAKLVGRIRAVLVRQSSTYQELVNRVLVSQQYMPTGISDRGLVQYEHCPIPSGYEANYTEVRQLWKSWRSHYSRHANAPLLIRSGETWIPVRKIEFGQDSNFFIQVPGDERMLCATDRIIWLSPAESNIPTVPLG
ncbi:hypothetical protein [Leptolyngbya sp. NIES-2104]|uniref:hypothetical protein n=1 Tax=Leptolyngbya sp. NIES-2104 TaxID=1552121 RepID=UPI0006ECCA87|nr:hypothetical protein [Leptolyngbya sp. NIES-2104]GAP93816.1 hypothetical protein NIES2104_03250 [Leptolyngbya sp. NIES-2104]